MFVVLDTNHFAEFVTTREAGQKLKGRMSEAGADYFLTIITAQEVNQGWMAAINRQPAGPSQVFAYSKFQQDLANLQKFTLLPFDEDAARSFLELKRTFPHIGTMDLKIAAICLTHDATLLTRNVRDFAQVSSLRVENWLD